MTYSMTAFARRQSHGDWGTATWEIRTVNHRYLEPSFRLPEAFRDLEPSLRDSLRKMLHRGKVEANLRYLPGIDVENKIIINKPLATALKHASAELDEVLGGTSNLRSVDMLRWPGMVEVQELELDAAKEHIRELFREAIVEINNLRAREGEALVELIEQRLSAMEKHVEVAKSVYPECLTAQKEKLQARIQEAKVEFDPSRLEQEMLILAQKSDVTEEIDRLATHIAEVRRTIKTQGAVGRRLDFLMQELNREANTLGSKSIHADISKVAVELKVLIEQMREQVQNIE